MSRSKLAENRAVAMRDQESDFCVAKLQGIGLNGGTHIFDVPA